MDIWHLTSVFLHIIAATFWIGGMLFLIVVLLPAIKNHPERSVLFKQAAVKFRTAGHAALGILLLTGFYNLHARGISLNPFEMGSTFQGMLGLKKLIIFVLIVLVNWLHDKYAGEKALRESGSSNKKALLMARWLGRLNLLLALTAVFLGIVIVRGWI